MRGRLLHILLLLFAFLGIKAQDPQFSQFFNNKVYLNPSLAGETRQWKFTYNSRLQWMSTPGKYVSNALTAELSIPANQTALAVQVLHDKTGTNQLTYVSYGFVYAFKGIISRKLKLNFGVKSSFNQRYLDESQMVFATDISQTSNTGYQISPRASYFDLSFGTSLVARHWWVGISADHVTQPYYSLTDEATKLPIKYSAHFMRRIIVKRGFNKTIKKSLLFGASYRGQGEWDQLDFGGYYKQKQYEIGMFYRSFHFQSTVPGAINHDALILLFGYRWQGLKLNYSYDITMSRLASNSGGSHEFSIITEYPFKPQKRRRSRRMLPCPKF